jgi:hypothetical protein
LPLMSSSHRLTAALAFVSPSSIAVGGIHIYTPDIYREIAG